jgi:hypothetical protein
LCRTRDVADGRCLVASPEPSSVFGDRGRDVVSRWRVLCHASDIADGRRLEASPEPSSGCSQIVVATSSLGGEDWAAREISRTVVVWRRWARYLAVDVVLNCAALCGACESDLSVTSSDQVVVIKVAKCSDNATVSSGRVVTCRCLLSWKLNVLRQPARSGRYPELGYITLHFHFLTSPIIDIDNCWLAGLRNRVYGWIDVDGGEVRST